MADHTPAQCVLVNQDARCPNCKRLIGAVGVLRTRRDHQPLCKGCWLWLSGQLPVEPGLEEEDAPPPAPPIQVSEEVQAEAAKRRASARKGAETARRKAAERKQGGGR